MSILDSKEEGFWDNLGQDNMIPFNFVPGIPEIHLSDHPSFVFWQIMPATNGHIDGHIDYLIIIDKGWL